MRLLYHKERKKEKPYKLEKLKTDFTLFYSRFSQSSGWSSYFIDPGIGNHVVAMEVLKQNRGKLPAERKIPFRL